MAAHLHFTLMNEREYNLKNKFLPEKEGESETWRLSL